MLRIGPRGREVHVALNLELGAIVLAAPGSSFDAAECNAPFN